MTPNAIVAIAAISNISIFYLRTNVFTLQKYSHSLALTSFSRVNVFKHSFVA